MVGETTAEPEMEPPVEKLTPALEEESTHVHESVAESPEFTRLSPVNDGGVQRSPECGDPQEAGIIAPPFSPDGEREDIPNSTE